MQRLAHEGEHLLPGVLAGVLAIALGIVEHLEGVAGTVVAVERMRHAGGGQRRVVRVDVGAERVMLRGKAVTVLSGTLSAATGAGICG